MPIFLTSHLLIFVDSDPGSGIQKVQVAKNQVKKQQLKPKKGVLHGRH